MEPGRRLKIALVGKPNSGKSSLFNKLTGLQQKIGNFPGITVDKRIGFTQLDENISAEIIDLPGIYSLYPRTLDEKIVVEILTDKKGEHYPDRIALIADATNLKNCLLLLTQLIDLGLPVMLALNMMDLAAKSGLSLDVKKLSKQLGVPVVMINARQGYGLSELKKQLAYEITPSSKRIFEPMNGVQQVLSEVQTHFNLATPYEAFQYLQQPDNLQFLSAGEKSYLKDLAHREHFFPHKYQGAETIRRYEFIQEVLDTVMIKSARRDWKKGSNRLDKILTHKFWGYLIFFTVLFLIFQSVFALAQIPMDAIDRGFVWLSSFMYQRLPDGPLFELISSGIVPGIGGIIIFIPQIAILFAFISILEETGYMSRVVFLMDKIMRQFGMSGRSVVPLMSGLACAIPAIMATRTIDNWKDRLITIFVTPLMSCSARLPVFTILVAMIIPKERVLGLISLQGIALMGLYVLGFLAAMFSALLMKIIVRSGERSFLIMEMPTYRIPKWSNVGFTIVEKTKTFVLQAGKIIIAVSIILWVLASYGPKEVMNQSRATVAAQTQGLNLTPQEYENRVAAYKLEHSYAGTVGKWIEPIIKPLGYDWKIGIALFTSFAAREVFVSTIATIYSLGSAEDNATIKDRLKDEINPETGAPRFTPAVGFSLLVFYTFAMQCVSTLAVVKRETKGWRWPLLQVIYMTGLAYVSALIVYQVLS
ncbi:MAG TPA: ferrous iron transport protein B [Cyclobacteriaceae bacterium]|nr:ferrous iron transport protein B [Cyclobacteriaceae bacterium]